jgi:hypothetical protein
VSQSPTSNDPAAARAFILARLGLSGPLWPVERAGEEAKKLGMIQIDSIRVNGLRNHEIAWAARTDAPVETSTDLYRDRTMLRRTIRSSLRGAIARVHQGLRHHPDKRPAARAPAHDAALESACARKARSRLPISSERVAASTPSS